MISSTPYLLTFAPVNRFFFGSSRSFAESFYAESMKFPQPATLLGCLRYTILRQYGIDPRKCNGRPDPQDERVKQLTGTSEGFDLEGGGDFGMIERLSPAFVVQCNEEGVVEDILFPLPADIEKSGGFYRYISYKKEHSVLSYYSGRKKEFALVSDKDPKLPSLESFGGRGFWSAYTESRQIPVDAVVDGADVFIAHNSIGIGCSNKDAGSGKLYFKKTIVEHQFYTKIDYSLHERFSLGIIVWLKSEGAIKDGIVQMGGERSTFQMRLHRIDDDSLLSHPLVKVLMGGDCSLAESMKTCTLDEKIIALSPLILDRADNARIAENAEHRLIGGVHAMRMLKPQSGGGKTESFCLIPSGSVLYPSGPEAVRPWSIPYKIGYNHVLKLKGGRHV